MAQNFAFSLLKSTPAQKKYTTVGCVVGTNISYEIEGNLEGRGGRIFQSIPTRGSVLTFFFQSGSVWKQDEVNYALSEREDRVQNRYDDINKDGRL